jgi:hypothetical protein
VVELRVEIPETEQAVDQMDLELVTLVDLELLF